jgi:adenylate kinase family enzyme
MKHPNRIYILGTSGTGKSYLGKILSEKYSLPFLDSDDIMFIKKFSKSRTREQRKKKLDKIARNKKWIIDARGSDWSIGPMKKADLIVWLQFNLFTRTWRILKRYFSRKGKYDEDFKSIWNLLKYSWSYKISDKLSGYKFHRKFIKENKLNPVIIKTNRQLKRFLRE